MRRVWFCPCCGSNHLYDQGGDEETQQYQCAGCDAFFSVRLYDREGEYLENCPACGKESDNYNPGSGRQSLCSTCETDSTR